MRAAVRIWRDAVSLPVTFRISPCLPVPFPLFLRTLPTVPTYFCLRNTFLCFFLFLFNIVWIKFRIFATAIRKERIDIKLDSHTITTVEIRANLHIGTVLFAGADFPYLKVVCGEPCDVWRMSAPLVF